MPYVVLKPTKPNNEYYHPQQQYITKLTHFFFVLVR